MRDDSAPAPAQGANVNPSLVWFAWFPRDFRSSTLGWPLVAKAIYRELLDAQFDMGGLPADPAKLRALVAATPTEWRHSWAPFLEAKFPVGEDGLRRNRRLEQHRQRAIAISGKRSEAGKLGAAAKAAKVVAIRR